MTHPEVSILIPVHRPDEDFILLLHQLTTQKFNVPHEIIVIEDGTPPEDGVARRKDFQRLLCTNIFLRRLETNQGPAEARNFGLQHARGRVFFLIDSDCRIKSENHLQRLYDAHLQFPSSVIGGGIQGEGRGMASFFERYCDYTNIPGSTNGPIDPGNHLRTSHMIVPRTAWRRAGPFDSALRTGEDKAFCIRCLQEGIELRLQSEIVIYHRDRTTWREVILRQIEIGKYRAACRSSALGRAPWYLTCPRGIRCFLAPGIASALTVLYCAHWITRDRRVLLALPGMWILNLMLAVGVIVAKVPVPSRPAKTTRRTLPFPQWSWLRSAASA